MYSNDNALLIKHITYALKNLKEATSVLKGGDASSVTSPNAMVPLRELQLILNPIIFSEKGSSGKVVAFFLNSFIHTIFMDLLGDIPDDNDGILKTIRIDFFDKLIPNMEMLLNLLIESANPYPAFEGLITLYSDTVNLLNYKDFQLGGPR